MEKSSLRYHLHTNSAVFTKTLDLEYATALNRPALLEARQRAQGVSQGGLGAVDSAIRKRFL